MKATIQTSRGPVRFHSVGEPIAGSSCLATLYRSYLNEFISVGRFAEYYGLSHERALSVIVEGRALHEAGAARAKGGAA